MPRPHLRKSGYELRTLFQQNEGSAEILNQIKYELGFRDTNLARELARDVNAALAALNLPPQPPAIPANPTAPPRPDTPSAPLAPQSDLSQSAPQVAPASNARDTSSQSSAASILRSSDANSAIKVLDSWIALEVLTPQTYRNPNDLADGDGRMIARFDDAPLPWENGRNANPPRNRLYFHVVLGSIKMDLAINALLASFGDNRAERPSARDFAALAVVTVDRHGRPIEDKAIAVSSFGWGYAKAKAGELHELGSWPIVERNLVESLTRLLVVERDGQVQPLTRSGIEKAFEWLAETVSLPQNQRVTPYFAIRHHQWAVLQSDPEPLLLNSFFIEDLAKARSLASNGTLGASLSRYLRLSIPEEQQDLLVDTNRPTLERLVSPEKTPTARWPANGGHPLVLLQQAAVNAACEELWNTSALMGINGPPGTGKTTLLRDQVADIVTKRAVVMATFDNPETAFSHRGQIRIGGGFTHYYELDQRLRGFEILVASSNNKAVENVSRELPARSAVELSVAPRYFRTTSDAIAEGDGSSWGLIAAVLGNAKNRSQFFKHFWQSEDFGLKSYLHSATGKKVEITETDPATGLPRSRLPTIVLNENPPSGPAQALQRWRQARTKFKDALGKSQRALNAIESCRAAYIEKNVLEEKLLDLQKLSHALTAHADQLRHLLSVAAARLETAKNEFGHVQNQHSNHRKIRPGLFSRLFNTLQWRQWSQQEKALANLTSSRRAALQDASTAHEKINNELRHILDLIATRKNDKFELEKTLAVRGEAYRKAKELLGDQFVDNEFWDRGHDERHKLTPWLPPQVQSLRDSSFAAALELHKAFIDAAAKPIRNNLSVIRNILLGRGLNDGTKAVLPSLWSTLFCVVPVISTTFASVARMLGPLPPNSLGCLLIDEAGQALPQAVVGAMMRAQRCLAVGDPLQIEPVVTLPTVLVDKVCASFGVEPDVWAAPKASVQSLVDAVSRYTGSFESSEGVVRPVGAPLLVHRRCLRPMFDISNKLSYANEMVQATPPGESDIVRILGPSGWFDIAGVSNGNWCPDETELAIRLLRKLADAGQKNPDVFIITPFRHVESNTRRLIGSEHTPVDQFTSRPRDWARERVGTVHTFQGKQAEAVIFILGASNPDQSGARSWAGSPPNLVNVAVSRAQKALYVIGNRSLWEGQGAFAVLAQHCPVRLM